MSKTAVIYARVSDKKQAENEVSVPAQIAAAERRAAELDASVLRVFTDQGRSAYKEDNRPTFVAAIDFATTVGADYFITWSSSRFARNQMEALVYKRALDAAKVQLVYVGATLDRGTDEGWMLDSMFVLMDEMFSRQNAKDTKRSMMANARNGYYSGGRPPYGYVSAPAVDNPRRKRLQVNDDEAETVRWIFSERASGTGGLLIARALNATGQRARGKPWTKRAVLEVLRSEAVIGQAVFNRTDSRTKERRPKEEWIIVENSHPAIIPMPMWHRVQELMNEGADSRSHGSPRSQFSFTGLVRCRCGAGMVIVTGKGKLGTVYSYYKCRATHQGLPCDQTQSYPAEKLDERLSAAILGRVFTRQNLAEIADSIRTESSTWLAEAARQSAQINRRIAELRKRNANLYDIMEQHGSDTPNLGDLTSRLRENLAEIKSLEQQAQNLRAEQATTDLPEVHIDEVEAFMRNALRRKDLAAKAREFYGQFIESIEIDGATVTITYNPARLAVASPAGVRSSVNWRPEGALLRTRKLSFTLDFRRKAA